MGILVTALYLNQGQVYTCCNFEAENTARIESLTWIVQDEKLTADFPHVKICIDNL